ncbi:hypothetical protein A1O3_08608 [Capronia epimyces CBS 606.96]|uniref:L-ornithine N(5)-monooxygenase n=1 Tax=Capronia epimyces CBS 606.96 TaxID=1182542 RepID=W9XF25_9EURO|nr:uncharacterized protein A1O3_08608 [Capronia epimyces CBS 606.96]EXJ79107.1 hypothetical protein A1O3_08608 [Capronia epimyces CBS 606.96]
MADPDQTERNSGTSSPTGISTNSSASDSSADNQFSAITTPGPGDVAEEEGLGPGPGPSQPHQTQNQNERPVKAIIIGAGIGGIATAVLLSHKVNNLTYTVYDKNERVGGTWAENRYPGVRCDIPSHVYQLTFAPNPDWSEYYSQGSEIQQYYERVVGEYGVQANLRLGHEVVSARWVASAAQWEVEVKDLSTDTLITDRADFLISAPGRVNQPHYPDIAGLQDFQGQVVHTARWPRDGSVELDGRRVAVIGNGASGQQILPNIVSRVGHIDHYVRSKTYVSPTLRQGLLEASTDIPGGYVYTAEEKARFRSDPAAYLAYRKGLDKQHYGAVNNQSARLGSEDNEKLRASLLATMLQRLRGDTAWLARLTPDYAPGCKRLTPAPGYLEAVAGPKVEFVDKPIVRATPTGLQTDDGNVRNVDVIILATGFQHGFYPRFPTEVETGDDLAQIWRPDSEIGIGYPETYLGIMAPDAPNYFFVLQAQGNAVGGSVPYQAEISATYIARVIRKAQHHGYKTIRPSAQAARDFSLVVDRYFEHSVVNSGCRTYFKLGGKPGKARNVIGFPASTRRRLEVLSEPRWEDFVLEDFTGSVLGDRQSGSQSQSRSRRRSRSQSHHDTTATATASPDPGDGDGDGDGDAKRHNRFLSFWGEGRSVLDKSNDLDAITDYLTEIGKVDLRRLHEPAVVG